MIAPPVLCTYVCIDTLGGVEQSRLDIESSKTSSPIDIESNQHRVRPDGKGHTETWMYMVRNDSSSSLESLKSPKTFDAGFCGTGAVAISVIIVIITIIRVCLFSSHFFHFIFPFPSSSSSSSSFPSSSPSSSCPPLPVHLSNHLSPSRLISSFLSSKSPFAHLPSRPQPQSQSHPI
jgi:hypothetical protein